MAGTQLHLCNPGSQIQKAHALESDYLGCILALPVPSCSFLLWSLSFPYKTIMNIRCDNPGPGTVPKTKMIACGKKLLVVPPHSHLLPLPLPHTDGQWAAARGSWQPKHTCRCGPSGGQLSWADTAPQTAVPRGLQDPSGQMKASTAIHLRASVRMTHLYPTSSPRSPTTLVQLGGWPVGRSTRCWLGGSHQRERFSTW